MLAKTAQIDIDALRAGGYRPTDSEIVELNELATRIESGKSMTPQNSPRYAVAGNCVLHELTIMAETWWSDFGRDAFYIDRWRVRTFFYAMSRARDPELSSLQTGRAIRAAVKEWYKSCAATEAELWRAAMWVLYADRGADEPIENKVRSTLEDERQRTALWMSLISAAGSLGTDPTALETKTRSELNALLVRSNLVARIPMKTSVAADYIRYRQILRTIEDRGTANG